ncbi:putative glycolipid-binding domain-containing protein [Haladaptatus caseinilyticus]|uniref:putative glycolipid-binding domain-containing protein n=1 Tax=Haladaptatus caseinilyticus TaxID=2993314 RepID=UPI00224AF9F2|nr:putative glycolipid-binding domain-containing protein [Haladaptatus caseinilyticus]
MKRHIVWELVDGISTEHLIVEFDPVHADGVVVRVAESEEAKAPFRVRYRVDCDDSETVREVEIGSPGTDSGIELKHDGEGNWTKDGESAPRLAGCFDVDIAVTPFTNTIPIRRLDWESGKSATISVVYLDVPVMTATAVKQRYTCLESLDSEGGLFRYESLESGFTAELPVDSDGVVEDYPDVFRRVEL